MLRTGLAALVSGMIFTSGAMAGDVIYRQPSRAKSAAMSQKAEGRMSAASNVASEASPFPGRGARSPHPTGKGDNNSRHIQTTSFAEGDVVYVNQNQPSPVPIQNAPVIPNMNPYHGPQSFSAVPTGYGSSPVPVYPGQNWQEYSGPVPVYQTSDAQFTPISREGMQGPVSMGMEGPISYNEPSGQYPETGASLYPSPVPGIPWQIGGTSIPNQAFHPHEMLYAHRYRAMYPPYYYKVNGGWMVTPFGVWSHEDWKLQGTTVDVKYRSSISPFSLYRGKGH
jgi:hypothetical protein